MTASDKSLEGIFRHFLLRILPGLTDQEVLTNTPRRYVEAFNELMGHNDEPWNFTTFESKNDEMVIVKDIDFVSLCAHHLMPFVGKAHVAYLPDGKVAGLSKLARTVRMCSRGIWTQEDLTMAIADTLEGALNPLGVGVVMEAVHTCMTIRGVKSPGSSTTTSAMRKSLRDKPAARAEFMALIKS